MRRPPRASRVRRASFVAGAAEVVEAAGNGDLDIAVDAALRRDWLPSARREYTNRCDPVPSHCPKPTVRSTTSIPSPVNRYRSSIQPSARNKRSTVGTPSFQVIPTLIPGCDSIRIRLPSIGKASDSSGGFADSMKIESVISRVKLRG